MSSVCCKSPSRNSRRNVVGVAAATAEIVVWFWRWWVSSPPCAAAAAWCVHWRGGDKGRGRWHGRREAKLLRRHAECKETAVSDPARRVRYGEGACANHQRKKGMGKGGRADTASHCTVLQIANQPRAASALASSSACAATAARMASSRSATTSRLLWISRASSRASLYGAGQWGNASVSGNIEGVRQMTVCAPSRNGRTKRQFRRTRQPNGAGPAHGQSDSDNDGIHRTPDNA